MAPLGAGESTGSVVVGDGDGGVDLVVHDPGAVGLRVPQVLR